MGNVEKVVESLENILQNITPKMYNIDEIKPYSKNAKLHDDIQIGNVAESIKQFGFVQPIVIDKKNEIIIGHCRYEASKKLNLEKVPCVKVDLSNDKVKKLRILDNKLNESAWDFQLLADDIIDLDFDGFNVDFGLSENIEETEIIEDEVPEIDEENEPITKLGDIWQLGRHRLMCGDSTSIEDVEKLMGGAVGRYAPYRPSV